MTTPPTYTVEVEFTDGVWTDVTDDVEWERGVSIHYGRQSEFSDPGPATLDLVLDNGSVGGKVEGRYTPRIQASPYWPNVLPRKRIRVAYTVGATTYERFTGYINSWRPQIENGYRPLITLSASCRMDALSHDTLRSLMVEELLADDPIHLWPLSTDLQDIVNGQTLTASVPAGSYALGQDAGPDGEGFCLTITASDMSGPYFTGSVQ